MCQAPNQHLAPSPTVHLPLGALLSPRVAQAWVSSITLVSSWGPERPKHVLVEMLTAEPGVWMPN